METIIRNIGDLPQADRSAAEQLVGHALTSDQRLVIVVQHRNDQVGASGDSPSVAPLPDWCNVYAGLSDEDIADIEAVMLNRADLSRDAD